MKIIELPTPVSFEPTEDDIREYAYHLYAQSNFTTGREIDNWFEAKACLGASIPKAQTHTRLQDHIQSKTGTKTPSSSPVVKKIVVL